MKQNRTLKLNCFNMMAMAVSFLLLTVGADPGTIYAGQAKPSTVTATAPLNPYLGELETLMNNAEDIYDHAKANKWRHVGNKLNAIKQSHLAPANETSPNLLPRLAEAMSDLEQAVASQHRLDSMIYANRIMIIGAKMAAPLNPRIPTNVAVIAFCARKLEILSETQHSDNMADIVYKIHLSWQSLIPQVIEHGGSKEIKRFAEIMKRLEGAKTPDEYARQASSVLEEVTVLEQIFLR